MRVLKWSEYSVYISTPITIVRQLYYFQIAAIYLFMPKVYWNNSNCFEKKIYCHGTKEVLLLIFYYLILLPTFYECIIFQ